LSKVISVFAIESGQIAGSPKVIPRKRESAPVHLIKRRNMPGVSAGRNGR